MKWLSDLIKLIMDALTGRSDAEKLGEATAENKNLNAGLDRARAAQDAAAKVKDTPDEIRQDPNNRSRRP